ncbi:MAG: glycosyltransferase family 9 protein, partial [Deltaproteobacteria bacterium]|nr:glycosyltransferase family 9 protein [Deltaproteobacteria bacterium]
AGLPVLGAAPVAAWPLKCWSPEKWREALTGFLRDTGGALLLFGGPGDAHVGQLAEALKKVAPGASRTSTEGDITPRVLSLAGNTTMLQSAWFASQCDLMVSHDTGMSHISEAVGRRVLVLFGPTSRELGYFPVRKDSRTLERPLGCRPCTRTGQGRCRHPWNGACLEGISANTVQSAIMEGLGI